MDSNGNLVTVVNGVPSGSSFPILWTPLGLPKQPFFAGMGFDGSGNLFVVETSNGYLLTLDTKTSPGLVKNSVKLSPAPSSGTSKVALAIDPLNGTAYYAPFTVGNPLYTLVLNTGKLTLAGHLTTAVSGLTFTAQTCPAPPPPCTDCHIVN